MNVSVLYPQYEATVWWPLSLGYSSGVERFPNMHNPQFPALQKQTTKTGSKLLHRRRAHGTESFPPSTSCLLDLCHNLAETVPAATALTKGRDYVVHGSSSRGGVLWNCEEDADAGGNARTLALKISQGLNISQRVGQQIFWLCRHRAWMHQPSCVLQRENSRYNVQRVHRQRGQSLRQHEQAWLKRDHRTGHCKCPSQSQITFSFRNTEISPTQEYLKISTRHNLYTKCSQFKSSVWWVLQTHKP